MSIERHTIGVVMIAHERERQIDEYGFTPQHDEQYTAGQLAQAAIHFALQPADEAAEKRTFWPADWGDCWDTKSEDDRVRQLAKAGALIAAEIDRLIVAASPR